MAFQSGLKNKVEVSTVLEQDGLRKFGPQPEGSFVVNFSAAIFDNLTGAKQGLLDRVTNW